MNRLQTIGNLTADAEVKDANGKKLTAAAKN